jgi:hypothetical protein
MGEPTEVLTAVPMGVLTAEPTAVPMAVLTAVPMGVLTAVPTAEPMGEPQNGASKF